MPFFDWFDIEFWSFWQYSCFIIYANKDSQDKLKPDLPLSDFPVTLKDVLEIEKRKKKTHTVKKEMDTNHISIAQMRVHILFR